MSENTIITINNVKLSQGMTVDYEKGDPVINSVFKKFDTDGNKTLDENEWTKVVEYNEKIQKRQQEISELKKDEKVVSHYAKKALKLQEKSEVLWKQIDGIPNEFNKLLDFEEKHPQISREGVKDKKGIPENCKEYDITTFEMGIYDEENQTFTGECYKNGYLKGLETLTDEERKEYMQLLDNAKEYITKVKKLIEKLEKNDEEIDKNLALKDLAQNGLIKKVGSSEYEKQVYTQYVQARNEANPFLHQIKDLEQQYDTLFRKGNKTDEENILMERIRIYIEQLRKASRKWSIKDLPENKEIQVSEDGFKITDISGQFTYNKEDNTEKYTDTHSVGMQYNKGNFNIQGNIEQAQIYKPGENTGNTFFMSLSGQCSKGNYTLSSNSSLSTDDSSFTYSQTLGGNYNNNFGIDYTKTFITIKTDAEEGNITTTSDKIGLSYNTGKFNNNASVSFAPDGTTYSIDSNTNFDIKLAKNINLNLSPSANMTYNQQNETFTLDPSLTAMTNYSNNGLNVNLMLSENYSTILAKGYSPQTTNMFMANGDVSYKRIGANLKYTDMDSPFNHTDGYGAELYYINPKIGRLAVEYNYQKMNNKIEDATTIETSTIIAKYSLPVDRINKWLSKKH